jgi:hypothetical protein
MKLLLLLLSSSLFCLAQPPWSVLQSGVFTGLHQAKGDEGALQAIAQHELAVAG